MKLKLKQFGYTLATIFSVATMLFVRTPSVAAAGSGTLTLTPASSSIDNGGTLTVTIKVNSATSYNVVEADLNYDATKLQFVRVDSSASDFDTSAPSSGGSGSVKVGKGSTTHLTGSHTFASIVFTVLQGGTTTPITFASSSNIVVASNQSNDWNGATAGGTYTLTTPSTGTGGTGTGGTGTGGTGTGSTGTGSSSGSSTGTGSTTPVTPKKVTPTPAAPAATVPVDQPVVVQKDVAATGYLVAILVNDNQNKVVKGATVTLNGETATTDATGNAGFMSVPAGTYTVTVKSGGNRQTQRSITVVDGDATVVQKFPVVFAPLKSNKIVLAIGIGGGVLILATVAFYIAKAVSAKRRFASTHIAAPVVTAGFMGSPTSQPATQAPPTLIRPIAPTEPTPPTPTDDTKPL